MDDGTAAALLALVIGFPILTTFLLFGMLDGAVFAGALVGGLAFAFVAAGYLSDEVESDDESERESAPDPLDELRGRYARSELSDEEFERRVETLLETETRANAEDYVDGAVRETERARKR